MFKCLLEIKVEKLRVGHPNISVSQGNFQNQNGDILLVHNTGVLDSIAYIGNIGTASFGCQISSGNYQTF